MAKRPKKRCFACRFRFGLGVLGASYVFLVWLWGSRSFKCCCVVSSTVGGLQTPWALTPAAPGVAAAGAPGVPGAGFEAFALGSVSNGTFAYAGGSATSPPPVEGWGNCSSGAPGFCSGWFGGGFCQWFYGSIRDLSVAFSCALRDYRFSRFLLSTCHPSRILLLGPKSTTKARPFSLTTTTAADGLPTGLLRSEWLVFF